jgi:hypothetical protein
MVCRRMGLLDDAIRDHLELKRRRGADPGEVAREQHEALEPVFPDDSASTADTADDGSNDMTEDSSLVAQETQELDMESVIEADENASETMPTPDSSAESRHAADWADELEDDPDVVREIPGQERLSFE